MDLIFLPIGTISLIAICIMIVTIVLARLKKWMMTYSLIIANFIVFILTMLFYDEIILTIAHNAPFKFIANW